jgi:phosphatidate cytidylyltransferase
LKNLVTRTFTGILFVVATVLSILWHEITFALFFFAVMILCILEYHILLRKVHGKPLIGWEIVLSILMYAGAWLYFNKVLPISAIGIVIPVFYLVFITELYRRKKRVIQNLAMTFLPVIHIALPMSLFLGIGYLNNAYDYRLVLAVLIFTWAYDTFAYVFGMLFGKNKIAPKISPKKSWEGLAGGFLSSAGIALILAKYWTVLPVESWIAVSLIISFGATFGDFVESMIKRAADVKDSGNVLPGHGGVFDRFDGFVFAIPFVFSYLYLIH